MSLPTPPNINQGQIALDPVNGVVYYKDNDGNLVATTWSWLRDGLSEVSTDDNVTITGDLTVEGETVTMNATQLLVEDNVITLNSNVTGAPILDAGIEVERGVSSNVFVRWNETTNIWEFTNDGTNYHPIPTKTPTFNSVQLNTAGTETSAVGKLRWDSDNGTATLGLVGGNVDLEVGQELVILARNAESTTISQGKLVYLYGATGDKASVKLADNRYESTSSKTVGIAAEDIAAGQLGLIIRYGVASKLSLGSPYVSGDVLWLGHDGNFTRVKPTAPEHLVFVGIVERANAGNGTALILIQNGFELDELHNVQINSGTLANGDVIKYNSSTSLWENSPIFTGVTLDQLSDVDTAGATANYFLKNNGSSWVASQITEILPLNSLSDVNTSGVTTDNVLKYNGSSWVAGAASTVAALDDLTDVVIISATPNNILKYDGSNWINATPDQVNQVTTTTITSNSATTIDSFSATTYRTAEYLIQVTQGTKYTSSKVVVNHNGTTPYMTEFAVVEIGTPRIPLTISATISGGNVLLQATITDAASTNATVKLLSSKIEV